MEDTQNCIVTFVDRLLKGDVKPFDTVVATIRMESQESFEEMAPDTFYHLIFHARSNYVTVMGAESEDMRPNVNKDKFTLQSRHDSCWRMDGFHDFREISMNMHRTWLADVRFLNIDGNIDFGSDEWNTTFSFNEYQKTITRND